MSTARFARPRKITAAIALIFVTGLGSYALSHHAVAEPPKDALIAKEALSQAKALSEAFKQVTKMAAPSVVNIRSTQKLEIPAINDNGSGEGSLGRRSPLDEDFLRRFFGEEAPDDALPNVPGAPTPRERVGEGTGVIAREDGYIITNNHVVNGATSIKVKLDDDREYDAKVVGTDIDSDLAVVKIDASGLNPAKFGDSDVIEPGEWVLAMGSPFGLQHTVTAGIVSAKGRSNMGLATYEDFIQTDAAINPGNSGGPLINLNGEVIGINTAISTRNGGSMGVGFAIPSNMVKNVLTNIIQNGKVKRGWLGIEMHPLDADLAATYGVKDAQGVLVARVIPESPASKAGLHKGDIITRFNGKPVADRVQLLNAVGQVTPGVSAQVQVLRNGKPEDLSITLADRSEQRLAGASSGTQESAETLERHSSDALGLTIRPLSADLAKQLGADDVNGVVVMKVDPASPAAEAGIRRGDVITAIGDAEVTGPEDFRNAIGNVDFAKGVRFELLTSGQTHFVVVKKDKK